MDLLHVNPAEPGLVDHGVIVFVPVQRLPAFDAVLGAHPAEDVSHTAELRTDRERNQVTVISSRKGNQGSPVGLTTHRDRPDGSPAPNPPSGGAFFADI